MEIEGTVAIVTGASSGIGRRIAERLAARGADVGLMGRAADRLAAVAAECRASGVRAAVAPAEIADAAAVGAALDALERDLRPPDILVNCAGISAPERLRLEDTGPALWDAIQDTNVRGTYLTCRRLLPGLKQRGRGAIVNIGSTGSHVALPGVSAYAASKFAVRALTEALAQECDGTGVRIGLVSSGPIDTPTWDRKTQPPPRAERDRMLKPDDIADAVLWLIERPAHVRIDEILLRPARPTPLETL